MNCISCGRTNDEGARFCNNCGARVQATPVAGVQALGKTTPLGEAPALEGETTFGEAPSTAGATRGLTVFGQQASADTKVDELPPGSMFDGRYSVVQLLGRGGMGAVYQAVDTQLKQLVALKALRREMATQPAFIESLTREVALANDLKHPNLLGVRHFEPKGTVPYVVMELMEGGDLVERVAQRGGRLEADEALGLMDGVLAGLEALHSARVTHLDVKPANVLIAKDGTPKLADFGISSRLSEQKSGGRGAGTPEYAPPEQLRGEPCDVRADVYASGMMLLELVSGGFPFERTMQAARAWHETGKRDFAQLPIGISAVVAKATAPKPDDRYRSISEFRSALKSGAKSKGWWNLPAEVVKSVEGRLAPVILVDGEERPHADPAALLRRGAARPSWKTRDGKVILETNLLAMASSGVSVDAKTDWQLAGVAALKGDVGPISSLKPQTALIEARLALACSVGGEREEAEIRLSRASKAAKSSAEWIAVAEAQASLGVNHAKSLEAAAQAAGSVTERLDLAMVRWALDKESPVAAVQGAADDAPDRGLEVAQAFISIGASDRLVDQALERARKEDPSRGAFEAVLAATGPRTSLRAWMDAIDGAAATIAEMEAVASLWARMADAARETQVRDRIAAAVARLQASLEEAQGIWRSTGFEPPAVASGTDHDERATASYSARARDEAKQHERALALATELREWHLAVPAWTRPYVEAEFSACTSVIGREKSQDARARQLVGDLGKWGYGAPNWSRPYKDSEFADADAAIKAQEAFEKKVKELDEEAEKLGISTCARKLPWTTAWISSHRETVSAQRALQERADEMTAAASREWLEPPTWALPVTEAQLRAGQAHLAAAREKRRSLVEEMEGINQARAVLLLAELSIENFLSRAIVDEARAGLEVEKKSRRQRRMAAVAAVVVVVVLAIAGLFARQAWIEREREEEAARIESARAEEAARIERVRAEDARIASSGVFKAAGREWQAEPSPKELGWDDAKAYCAGLTLAGGGWRLPDKDEIKALYDTKSSLSGYRSIKSIMSGWYWSSSPGRHVRRVGRRLRRRRRGLQRPVLPERRPVRALRTG